MHAADTPPGTLNWKPTANVPQLLAAPVAAALATLDVEAMAAPIDPDLADTAAFCATYEVGLEVSANCVVIEGRRGERTTLAAIMVLATDRADVNKTIRKHLGVRKISFAPIETATSLTGMEYGGITPIGLPANWPILIDQSVVAGGWMIVGSGIRGSKIAIHGPDLARLPSSEILALTIN